MLKGSFLFGAVLDGIIAVSWFCIAAGIEIPNILNGYVGSGSDYRLAMYVSGMFMAGWAVVLGWGSLRPVERRGLLPITSAFLALSVLAEVVLYGSTLFGGAFLLGATKRLAIATLFFLVWRGSFGEDDSRP